MNILTFPTLDENELVLNISANLQEITFGQLIELQKADITNFEVLSILSGVPVDDLYNCKSYDEVTKMANLYIDLFNHTVLNTDLNIIPQKVIVSHAGKLKTIKLNKYLSMEPAGAHIAASKIISSQIQTQKDLTGDSNWQYQFQPSFESCAAIVDAFLYYQVTGKWVDQGRDKIAEEMAAADVLAISKYFFNVYPNLSYRKPQSKLSAFYNAFLMLFKTLFSIRGISITLKKVKQTS